jgi:hypothetical protein
VKRFSILLTIVLLAALTAGTSAAAAKRRVPYGFFGVVVDPTLAWGPAQLLESQSALMAKSGVESMRVNFAWDLAEPQQGHYDWALTDQIVHAAAGHGLQLLPIVEFTPRWASSNPFSNDFAEFAPSHPSTFGSFMTALIRRYGPHGSYWAANPRLPRRPIRTWQIWNEPEGTIYDWRSKPWPSTYTALLKAAYGAVHGADRGATVVSGALVSLAGPGLTQWQEMSSLYRAGAKHFFDVLAVNAFTGGRNVADSVARSLRIVDRVRGVMRRHGDGRKRIWITEVTWTASAGRIPRSDYAGFETTPTGQAKRLTAYYQRIATQHTDGIARAYWYTWFSSYSLNIPGDIPTFRFAGLTRWDGRAADPFHPQPGLAAYAKVAARFEGCRKTTRATCR